MTSRDLPFRKLPGPVGTQQYGGEPGSITLPYFNRAGAVTKGDVLQVDILATDAATTTADNTETGIYGSVIVPRAGLIAATEPGIVVVATEDAADNTEVKCCIFGEVEAFVIGAAGSMAVGTDLVVTTAKNFDIVTATGERIFAIGAEAVTTPTTRTLGLVYLDNGFGYCAGVTAA